MDDVFKAFAERVADQFPELRAILDQTKNGTITETDGLRVLSEVMAVDPALSARFRALAMEALTPLPEEDRAQPLDHDRLILHKQRGLPRLNPLVEAALIERAQFDGDIPELRTGPLPPGVPPAVPVDTRVRDPAVLGHMLREASRQVAEQVAATEPERRKLVAQVAEGDPLALALIEQSGQALTVAAAQDAVFDGKTVILDIPEYRRGQVPVPIHVLTPSGSALAAMTPQERKQGAWQFLSTTQGRRSAVAGLTELVEVKLRGEGFEVQVRPFEPGTKEPVVAAHEWTVGIDGPGAMQPAFSLIDIAAASIAKGLTAKAGDRRGQVILEVTAINTVDVRSVGWAGRLLTRDRLLPGRTDA